MNECTYTTYPTDVQFNFGFSKPLSIKSINEKNHTINGGKVVFPDTASYNQ